MTSIIIAGRPNCEEMSECIILSENISNLYPSSRFTIVLKHQNEWEKYCEDICNLFGIVKKTHPLILFSNGNQIGGTQQFFKLIYESFKFDALIKDEKADTYYLNVNSVGVSNLTKENTMLVEKEYVCRTKDLFISDKIKNKLSEIPIDNFDKIYNKYNTIDNDYDEEYFKDMKVYVKYDQKYTPNESEYKEEDDVIEEKSVIIPGEEYAKYLEEEAEKKRLEEERIRLEEEQKRLEEEKNKPPEEKKEGEEENKEEEVKEEVKEEVLDTKGSKKSKKKEGKDNTTNNTKDNVEVVESNPTMTEEQKTITPEDKEIKFCCFRDLDIPLETFDEELIVERHTPENFELIINPYFTFYGETLINTIVDYVPKKEPVKIEEKPKEEEKKEENKEEVKEGEAEKPKEEIKEEEKKPEDANKDEPKKEEPPKEEAKKEEPKKPEEAKKEDPNKKSDEVKKDDKKADDDKKDPNAPQGENKDVPIEEKKPEHIHNPNLPTTSDPNSQNDKHPSKILIKDYGKLPSLRIMNYSDPEYRLYHSSIPVYQLPKNVINTSNLYNFEKPLFSEKDLTTLIQMVHETNGYATLRILPYKYSDWKSFSSSKIRIIPRETKELKLSPFPLEEKIAQQIQDIKRDLFAKTEEKTSEKHMRPNYELILNNDDFSDCFKIPSYFTLDVYSKEDIKHLVKYFPKGQFNLSNLRDAIKDMMSSLEIDNVTGNGMIMICSQTFLFIAPLISPFAFTKKDTIPIFAEPYFFMGAYTLPLIEAEWPESVQRKYVKFDIVDILKKTTS